MKDSPGPRRPGSRGNARGFARRTTRTLALILAFTLVVALGLNLDGPPAESPPPLSFTEQAQVDAEAVAMDLAAAATQLSDSSPSSPAGPGVGEAYAQTAGLLQQQAAALSHPVHSTPPESATIPSAGNISPWSFSNDERGPASPSVSPSAPPEPVPTPTGFVADLFASAQQNQRAAVAAEPGIARLLASVGVSQWHQALTLAGMEGLEVPERMELPAAAPELRPECPATEALNSREEALNSGEAERLTDAVTAEHHSAYAYQVAAARAPDAGPLTEEAELHASAAAAGEDLLREVACSGLPPQVPAFALDPGFFDNPSGTLVTLNADLMGMYADLVGLTDGSVRWWALERFSDVADRWHLRTDTLLAFPGITG